MSAQKVSNDYKHALFGGIATTLVVSWQGRLDLGYFARVFAWVVIFVVVLVATAAAFHDD